MSEHDLGPEPTVVELDESILYAKLMIPHPRSGEVSRAGLIQAARESGCRVVGVTAPAGYGKSTLLAQWALAEKRPVGWVTLDRIDDDPAALLTLLASACRRILPGNSDLIAEMGGLGISSLGRAAPRLASALRASASPFVLMLDDLHELGSPACHDVLSVVISGIPRGSQFVAASRSEQPHLPRLRVARDALELRASDLAMDAGGAETIFAEARISLTHELATVVTERTEGWPAGLYLAAMIARDSTGQALTVSGDDRYVADYLYRESLMQLPERTQRFLRRTAVLDQLSGPLCDALLGERGGQGRLRDLEASSLFLIPLDRQREWYRYHALFREFLLGELRRVESDNVTKLHLRAADWYQANGSPAMALEYLLNTAERNRCVQLMMELILPTYSAGQISTVQRWLSVVGDAAIEEYPPLAVLAGWTAALAGHTTEAQRWAALADAATFDEVPLDGTASFDSARAMLRALMCAHGPQRMMSDASLAVAQEPPWSAWRDTALLLSAEAHLLTGDTVQACALSRRHRPREPRSETLTRSSSAKLSLPSRRWISGGGGTRPSMWNWHSPLPMSIGCTTMRRACSPSPSPRGLACTEARYKRLTVTSLRPCGLARHVPSLRRHDVRAREVAARQEDPDGWPQQLRPQDLASPRWRPQAAVPRHRLQAEQGRSPAKVASIEYDPNRTCRIALLHYLDGEKRYILAPKDLKVGDTVQIRPRLGDPGRKRPAAPLHPGGHRRAQRRVQGRCGRQDGPLPRARASSSSRRRGSTPRCACPPPRCVGYRSTAAAPSARSATPSTTSIKIGKAGRNRWKGVRPQTRGVAMNPVDHPHGGGEGKTSGGRHPVSPWGKPEGRTRDQNKPSQQLIVRRRRTRGSRR